MNLSQRNNNPINLRYAGQRESIGKGDGGFALFPSAPAGWRAAHAQIALDQTRRLSLREFMSKFAPPEENDTKGYLEFVCNELCVSPQEDLKNISKYALAGVMAKMEGYYNKEEEEVQEA